MIRSYVKKVVKRLLEIQNKKETIVQKSTSYHSKSIPKDKIPEKLDKLPFTKENIQLVINSEIAPALEADGGGIQLIGVEGNEINVCLTGACNGCPSAKITLAYGVEKVFQEKFSNDIKVKTTS